LKLKKMTNNQPLKIKINKLITSKRITQGLLRVLTKLNNEEAIRAHYTLNVHLTNLNRKLRLLEEDEERRHFRV
jgi:hypothetical protein